MVDEDFTWRLAQELVRIDSSDPGAYEGELERFVKALVEERDGAAEPSGTRCRAD